MAADTLFSPSITGLDSLPAAPTGIGPVAPTTGEGGPGYSRNLSDFVKPTTGGLVSTSSIYKMVRVPTNVKVKGLKLTADGALDSSTGLALDVGLYYSDSTTDGTPFQDLGAAINVNLFAAAITSFHSSAVGPNDALGNFSVALRNQPLWEAAGLSSDPGGFFDIVVAVHTAATTAVSNNLGLNLDYVD